jgi:endonuclease YncB( thermonuclease family)
LRLAEVDCPESKQPFGKNAKQFTSSKIFGKQIIYQPIQKDRYGRTIAKVYFDNGKYLSEELIKNGLGWWYSKYSKNKNLGNFQSLAKTKKLSYI